MCLVIDIRHGTHLIESELPCNAFLLMTQLSTTPIAIGIAQHEETRCLIVIDAHQCDSPPQMSTPTQTVNKLLPGPIRRRSSLKPLIPLALQKPGIEMLKVSVKSSRRVKSRKAWLEMGTRGSSYDTEDIRVCWEKNSRGVGALVILLL